MRLWSLAPEYLDVKGLLAVWREGLLAKKVLEGKTEGYTAHPQLWRFRQYKEPRKAITAYLAAICAEAKRRGYSFDATKLESPDNLRAIIPVTEGQVAYEWTHLLKKLYQRDIERWNQLQSISLQEIKVHPLFYLVPGPVENWEKVL
ncbi:MAG: pyrimidine dimer DNA glycosylase/endonuclease V [Treponemataceae bacterium]|nr:pyrimidine dimer DNA glycosylase/endonuclease V [Treponemataceae bacterium]